MMMFNFTYFAYRNRSKDSNMTMISCHFSSSIDELKDESDFDNVPSKYV